jgi:hypothetical protein
MAQGLPGWGGDIDGIYMAAFTKSRQMAIHLQLAREVRDGHVCSFPSWRGIGVS